MEKNAKIIKSNKSNSILLTEYILEEHPRIIRDADNERLYIYNGKYYSFLKKTDIDRMIYTFFKKYDITGIWKMNRINEIKKSLNATPDIETVTVDNNEGLICLSNGVLNIETMEFFDHSDRYYFTSMIDVDYNENAIESRAFQRLLDGMFTLDNGKPDTEMINILYQIGGDLIYPKIKVNQEGLMYLFLGSGANGKSMLIDTIQMFFPKNNITFLDLARLCGDGHTKTRLFNSRLNVCSEEKGNTIDSEELKKIISGDGITINPKFEEPFEFVPKTKIILASNKKPYFSDTTYGIYRRIYTIEFKNRFVSNLEYQELTTQEKERRVFIKGNRAELLQNIYNERSAIFNKFLYGLTTLKKNSWELPETDNTRSIMEEYKISGDTIGYFLKEHYEYSVNAGISLDMILAHYREWYRQNVSEKPLNYSVISLGIKIKELYRVESQRIYDARTSSRKTVYPLKLKDDLTINTEIELLAEELGGTIIQDTIFN